MSASRTGSVSRASGVGVIRRGTALPGGGVFAVTAEDEVCGGRRPAPARRPSRLGAVASLFAGIFDGDNGAADYARCEQNGGLDVDINIVFRLHGGRSGKARRKITYHRSTPETRDVTGRISGL